MKKEEIKKELETVIDELMNYKLTEMLLQSVNEAQNDLDSNEKSDILMEDLNLLTAWLDEYKNGDNVQTVDKAETRKALEKKALEKKPAFKWLTLDGYKMLSVKKSAFENVTKNSIIAYRMDKIVIENLKRREIEYADNMTFNDAIFDNDIDYCKVTKKTADYIDVESLKNSGATFRIWIENFEKCIDNVNVAFRICEKIA